MELGNLMYGGGEAPAPEQPIAQPEGGFLTKLRSDPAMLQSMMMAGARLMQGARPGDNPMAAFGDALMIGNATHQMLSENQRKAELDLQEQQRRNQLADANIGQVQANTARLTQQMTQDAQSFPETQKKLAAEVKRLTSEGNRAEAMAKIEEFKSDPARLAQTWGLDLAAKQANINQSNAAAGASGAAADAQRANADFTRRKTSAADSLLEEGQPGTVLHGSPKVGAGAAKDTLAGLKITLKAAYPDMSEADIAKKALDLSSSRKGEQMDSLKALLDYGTADQRKWAQEQLAGQAGFGGGNATRPAAPSGKSAGASTALPPIASRVIGNSYATPRGMMKWTAEGWVNP